MKYKENTLRRRAHRIGYHIQKGFIHSGRYVYRDSYGNRYKGYMVMDLHTGFYVWGCCNSNFDFQWNLADVEQFLKDEFKARGLVW